MTNYLSKLNMKQLREKIKDIFIWPSSLEDLNRLKENKFKLASFDEIIYFHGMKFPDKDIDGLRGNLTLHEQVKLHCLSEGYSGLVESSRVVEPYADIAGTVEINFKAMKGCSSRLINGMGEPYNAQAEIPFYITNFRIGYKGLPVREETIPI